MNPSLLKEAVVLTLGEAVVIYLINTALTVAMGPPEMETIDFYRLLMTLVSTMISLFGAYLYYFWKAKAGGLTQAYAAKFALAVLVVTFALDLILPLALISPRIGFQSQVVMGTLVTAVIGGAIHGFVTYLVLALMLSRNKPAPPTTQY